MTKTERVYYIVAVKLREMKAFDGKIITEDLSQQWLSMKDGYPRISSESSKAYHFDKLPTLAEIAKWDGMPWYCRIIPGSAECLKIEEVIEKKVKETFVELG